MDKNRIRGLPARTSEPQIAKSTTIKGRGGKSGRRAGKAVELTSGGLCRVRSPRTERVARPVIAAQKSADGIVGGAITEGPNGGGGKKDGDRVRPRRWKHQRELPCGAEGRGKPPAAPPDGTEARAAAAA